MLLEAFDYLPATRYETQGATLLPSAAVYNGTVYVAWYEPTQRTNQNFPTRLKIRRLTHGTSGFSLGSLWTWVGTSTWNCPYRLDVFVGSGSPRTVGITFLAAYGPYIVDDPLHTDQHLKKTLVQYVNRDILTTTDDGLNWLDTRTNIQFPNWTYSANMVIYEYYRSWMDYSTNTIYDTWDEYNLPYNDPSKNVQTFMNKIEIF